MRLFGSVNSRSVCVMFQLKKVMFIFFLLTLSFLSEIVIAKPKFDDSIDKKDLEAHDFYLLNCQLETGNNNGIHSLIIKIILISKQKSYSSQPQNETFSRFYNYQNGNFKESIYIYFPTPIKENNSITLKHCKYFNDVADSKEYTIFILSISYNSFRPYVNQTNLRIGKEEKEDLSLSKEDIENFSFDILQVKGYETTKLDLEQPCFDTDNYAYYVFSGDDCEELRDQFLTENQETPDDQQQETPDDQQETPDDQQETPDDQQQETPDDQQQETPDDQQETPDDQQQETPDDQQQETPDDQQQETPDDQQETPDDQSQTKKTFPQGLTLPNDTSFILFLTSTTPEIDCTISPIKPENQGYFYYQPDNIRHISYLLNSKMEITKKYNTVTEEILSIQQFSTILPQTAYNSSIAFRQNALDFLTTLKPIHENYFNDEAINEAINFVEALPPQESQYIQFNDRYYIKEQENGSYIFDDPYYLQKTNHIWAIKDYQYQFDPIYLLPDKEYQYSVVTIEILKDEKPKDKPIPKKPPIPPSNKENFYPKFGYVNFNKAFPPALSLPDLSYITFLTNTEDNLTPTNIIFSPINKRNYFYLPDVTMNNNSYLFNSNLELIGKYHINKESILEINKYDNIIPNVSYEYLLFQKNLVLDILKDSLKPIHNNYFNNEIIDVAFKKVEELPPISTEYKPFLNFYAKRCKNDGAYIFENQYNLQKTGDIWALKYNNNKFDPVYFVLPETKGRITDNIITTWDESIQYTKTAIYGTDNYEFEIKENRLTEHFKFESNEVNFKERIKGIPFKIKKWILFDGYMKSNILTEFKKTDFFQNLITTYNPRFESINGNTRTRVRDSYSITPSQYRANLVEVLLNLPSDNSNVWEMHIFVETSAQGEISKSKSNVSMANKIIQIQNTISNAGILRLFLWECIENPLTDEVTFFQSLRERIRLYNPNYNRTKYGIIRDKDDFSKPGVVMSQKFKTID